jgi:hypothetical protein
MAPSRRLMRRLSIVALCLLGFSSSASSQSTDILGPTKVEESKLPFTLPPKWKTYPAYEALRVVEKLTPMVPSELPDGLSLQLIECLDGQIRSTYTDGTRRLVLLQTFPGSQIEVMGTGMEDTELQRFENSLFPLPPIVIGEQLSFRTLEQAASQPPAATEKTRSFAVWTGEAFPGQKDGAGDKAAEESPSQTSKELVLGLYAGPRNSSGYNIQVDKVQLEKDRVYVTFHETSPGNGSYLAVITYPRAFVAVELPDDAAPKIVQFITPVGEAIASVPISP